MLVLLLAVVERRSVEATSLTGDGSVAVAGRGVTKPVDPENPTVEVNPGESPATTGALRIDYASAFDFGKAKITAENRVYYARGQLFHDDTSARGSYLQITDERANASGWTLQVKQNYQFRSEDTSVKELAGAVLSLDKGWVNGGNLQKTPTITRDTINISNINNAYEVATAAVGEGYGTWTIEFGATAENSNQQLATLVPLVDENGAAVIDESYHKPAYQNTAISLSVPDAIKIYPVQYQTELTWILAELP
ncbi:MULTISPECIES: WxL domain-containing protein [unclassified Enterococcus]|uniref:WxL domain-containing protein n=1 Tax=unclassified Enterococcus TaxID=2608891 RepID=UPI0024767E6A|nr:MULTISPECIES: WxL domain-containing protein [unclassified Enterococcus]